MGHQHGDINVTRLVLLFVLFLVSLYFYLGSDTTETLSEYEEDVYWAQKACTEDKNCISGYYCNTDAFLCEPIE